MPSTMLNTGKDRGKTLTREGGGEAGKRILPSARSAEAGKSMGSSGAQGHLTTPGGRAGQGSCQEEEVPETSPKGGVGFNQTKKTWKAVPGEETAYTALVGMMFNMGVWVGCHMRRHDTRTST